MKPKALNTTLPMQFTVNKADTDYFCSLLQANKLNIDPIECEVDDCRRRCNGNTNAIAEWADFFEPRVRIC